ncbi:MFS transporter [Streptosporangium subroseum]|uniref:MFS transporter n=1 Tax=Streptosporangium subroseum TaxID=106412 RepID=UPI0030895B6C|nr:MFS transporter [Streptosporangium subroseum]
MRLKRPVSPAGGAAGERRVTVLLTMVMGVSMLQLFLIGALGPRLVGEAGISRTVIGLTTTAGFGVAALLSLTAGRWVDRLGARRCLVAVLLLAAVALTLIGSASGTFVLLAAVALSGLPQALANPATNKIILAVVEPARRGAVTGWKQSGVQLGAFAAGLPLAALAVWTGWRGAVWTAAAIAVLIACWALRALPPDSAPATAPPSADMPRARVGRLALFSFLLGCGIAAVNTYLALFGAERLGLGPVVAAWLIATLGITGVVGRVGWSRRAGGLGQAEVLLAPLAAGACGAALLLGAASWAPFLVWVGAAAVGAFAVAGNAVTMVSVIKRANPRTAGRDSALVSAGFFAGFAAGPPAFGILVELTGYGPGWVLVAAEFAAAAAVAAPLRLRTGARR